MRPTLSLPVLAGLVLAAVGPACLAGKAPRPVKEVEIQKVREAAPEKARAEPAQGRTMLVYNKCQGFRHGSIGIGAKAMEILGEKTGAFTVTVTDDETMLVPEKLKAFDAVCINNATSRFKKDDPTIAALETYVKEGGGLVGIHAATDGEYGQIFGGTFNSHPWGSGSTVGVKIDDPDHALTQVFKGQGFMVKDEIYAFGDLYSRDKLRVLLALDMEKTEKKGKREDNDYAVAWIKELGKGRIFYCSLGHNHHIFWTPDLLQFYLDGIQYAMGDLEADATPSAKVAAKAFLTPAGMRIFAAPIEEGEPFGGGKDGEWTVLFNGKSLDGWTNKKGEKPGDTWKVEDGAMVLAGKGGGDIWTEGRYGDFVLALEFKTTGNSGIFIRTDNPQNNVQTGIEIQVHKPVENPGDTDVGAFYDLKAPTTCTATDDWNKVVITAKDNVLSVEMNGETINEMDLDQWTEPRKNPDGSKNKFKTALKDFKRDGHIGFQDHRAKVMYRNVKIQVLDGEKKEEE